MNGDLLDRRVVAALGAINAGRHAGMADLFDLLGGSVYELSQAVTGQAELAEDATVETFTRIWTLARHRSPESTATRWVLDLACDVACVRRAGRDISATNHHP
jgi:DNA-directed RNA polymerase specialized sigma24 family protein